MTRRREIDDLEKVTLNLYRGDFGRLRRLHAQGAGAIVRWLVRSYLKGKKIVDLPPLTLKDIPK